MPRVIVEPGAYEAWLGVGEDTKFVESPWNGSPQGPGVCGGGLVPSPFPLR
jgi:hypothetical protein